MPPHPSQTASEVHDPIHSGIKSNVNLAPKPPAASSTNSPQKTNEDGEIPEIDPCKFSSQLKMVEKLML